MLLQLITTHPDAIGPILRGTPLWVWGLLTGLLALGLSQMRERTASLSRVSLLPLAMTVFSVSGTWTALGGSPHLATAVAVWAAAAVAGFALLAPGRAGGQFDPARRVFHLPDSAVPLLLIVGIFLVKYGVGIELTMAPRLVDERPYALTIAALYGAFTGVFVGRAWRLLRLALRPATARAAD